MALISGAGAAHGVEASSSKPMSASERWAIVGVIADNDQHGIAVLKNMVSGRTFTVEVGEQLPTDFGLVLHSVQDRKVLLSDGEVLHPLTFAEASGDEVELPSRTARFLDNYYRGLNEMPMEIFSESEGEGGEQRPDGAGLSVPLSTFGRLKGDAPRSRFELYRAEQRYDGEDDAGFIVNYDNFEDDPNAEGGAQMGGGFDLSTAEASGDDDAASDEADASGEDEERPEAPAGYVPPPAAVSAQKRGKEAQVVVEPEGE
jgi:hypothetical protein